MRLVDTFLEWKEAFESKGLKTNLMRTKVVVSSIITKDCMSKGNVGPCGVCSLRVMANSSLCVQYGNWIHSTYVRMKRMTPNFQRRFACRKCDVNIGEAVEQTEMLCDEVETVREFTYLGDRVSAGGGCEAAVTARIRCGWVKLGSAVSFCMTGDFL